MRTTCFNLFIQFVEDMIGMLESIFRACDLNYDDELPRERVSNERRMTHNEHKCTCIVSKECFGASGISEFPNRRFSHPGRSIHGSKKDRAVKILFSAESALVGSKIQKEGNPRAANEETTGGSQPIESLNAAVYPSCPCLRFSCFTVAD